MFVAVVSYTKTPYMEADESHIMNMIVEADYQSDAEDKIQQYFAEKNESYSNSYVVNKITFWTHLK